MNEHEIIIVSGIVQGVGYRPFVYRLACELGIRGNVRNSGDRVIINAVAPRAVLGEFKRSLITCAPFHARPDRVECTPNSDAAYESFAIIESDGRTQEPSPGLAIPPDLATCPDCIRELFDPRNRRFRYPFINCTNCGPRYSIVSGIPYDRDRTTMRGFAMCPDCLGEYHDPTDRRFHAEPIACPHCGPRLQLLDESSRILAENRDDVIRTACRAISEGRIVAAKGIGGFHLLVDARSSDAVARLRTGKAREAKPLALMYPTLAAVRADCEVSPDEGQALTSCAAPIVLLQRRDSPRPHWQIAADVAPGNPRLGIMLPYSPLHHLLMQELGFPVVATSANRSEEPICFDNEEALDRLEGIADLYLVHDRPIQRYVDDSVVMVAAGRMMFLRRSRGFVPTPIAFDSELPSSLALGGQQKCTVAVAAGSRVLVSRHIGDLDSMPAARAFEDTIKDITGQLGVDPAVIAHDLHPEYYTTRCANTSGKRTYPVQHHFAHILSVMADNGLDTDVLGIAWDGTGYGDDGTIWGGEFLKCNPRSYARFASLRPFPLVGGEAAIREPRRVALALLNASLDAGIWDDHSVPPIAATSATERQAFQAMSRRNLNCPMTSSMGRLFDGVASLLGLCQEAQFEGQAAMELEYLADDFESHDPYAFDIESGDTLRIDWRPMIRGVIADCRTLVAPSVIASRFHSTLAAMSLRIAQEAQRHDVVLGGGCFQNRMLLERLIARLSENGFAVWWPNQLPPNDGGLALGQIAALRNCRPGGS